MATKMEGYTEGHAKQKPSPSTQQTDDGLRAVKTYNNAESCARHEEDSWEATDVNTEGCNQEGTLAHSEQTPV